MPRLIFFHFLREPLFFLFFLPFGSFKVVRVRDLFLDSYIALPLILRLSAMLKFKVIKTSAEHSLVFIHLLVRVEILQDSLYELHSSRIIQIRFDTQARQN